MAKPRSAPTARRFELPEAAPLTSFDPFALAKQFDQMRAGASAGGPGQFVMPAPKQIEYGGRLAGPAAPTWAPQAQRYDGAVRSVPGKTAAAGSGYRQWVDTIAQIKGLNESDKKAFYSLGMGESGGRNIAQGITDINTKKGTPAYGPWQVIRPTFERYKEPGYDNWQDPIANGLASLNYQRARYGALRSRPGY